MLPHQENPSHIYLCNGPFSKHHSFDTGDQSDLHVIIFDEIDAICKVKFCYLYVIICILLFSFACSFHIIPYFSNTTWCQIKNLDFNYHITSPLDKHRVLLSVQISVESARVLVLFSIVLVAFEKQIRLICYISPLTPLLNSFISVDLLQFATFVNWMHHCTA